jgi:alkanesulfonate monooxygenase SsuD/methylene tetrahydromethanopterin reductase-like flavin-dependent oxidoreductase (luciferase family)
MDAAQRDLNDQIDQATQRLLDEARTIPEDDLREPSLLPGWTRAHVLAHLARGPRAVRLVGAKADGWSVSSPYVPPPRLAELGGILTESAREAGRDPDQIVRLYNVMGLITPDGRDMFNGPAERWIDTLTTLYTDFGMNTFVFWPSGDRERQSRIFADEVVPAVHEALGGN